ncbi:hypothetical protein RclHR1_03400021 [Rhizophagus clarus]|uniref:C2H2-type domain-containing protein n=1 Tax=Rhizophagus clarus TaxID=94130 RepID=A0A2Z6RPL2_9GLOM|nr:hypothetical protein RclHR1_03400021 [Rhizophagus clarus]
MVIHTCDRCDENFPKLWKLRRHQKRQFQCRQKIIPKVIQPLPDPLVSPIIQSPKNQEDDPEAGPGPATQANREEQAGPSEVTQSFQEEHAEYFEGMKKIVSIEDHAPEGDIHFKEGPVGRDLERSHQNWSLMRKWEAKVPRRSNPAYAFNNMVKGGKNYNEIPYMPKLIASARQEMTRVFQTEFRRKEQINEKWHRGEMRALLSENYIDEHLTSSGGEIDKKIEEYLENGSNWILVRIDIVSIEVYIYSRATGGSYEPTPKKLANTKCTINPDNNDPKTNVLSEKCLQGALGCYFAHQDGHTDHIDWCIFRAKNLKLYLERVKLDSIPMPTPICPRIFNKIEEMNPDISINVWEWKEETAIPKPVIAIHHQEHCFGLGEATQRVNLPVKGVNDFEQFKNYSRMINAPCVIIADFEAGNKRPGLINGGKTCIISEQYANSFCYLVHWIDTGDVWGPYLYRAIKHKRIVTEEDKKKFAEADTCWICKGKFTMDKVWDHCHITGKFRGSAHRDCNLKLQIEPWKTPIPVIFQTSGSMKVGQLKYIDSQQFMNNSLANLTKNLGDDHPITSQHFKDFTPGQISLATHKGLYCYDYINSQDRFLETELPPIHEFTTTLKGKISQEDYHYAQKVWKTYGCKNLGEYHDLYFKIDVLSLADVWTQFRKTCIKYYELDSSHYVSAPSLSWDAMLKKTGVKIELFTDMLCMTYRKGQEGGF